MKTRNQFMYASFAVALITAFICLSLDATEATPAEQVTASSDCPKPACNMKIFICLWHALKASVAYPAILLSSRHWQEASELFFSDEQRSKTIYQLTNSGANAYCAYALLKSAYEGIQKELFEDTDNSAKDTA